MEGRIIEYSRPINGLDYHNSPLIGEIAASDYTYYRSIDQLRTTINEREVLQTITSPHASTINGSVSLIPTTASTTDLRTLDFNHKHYPSSVGRINGLHEIEVQPVKSVQHHHQLNPVTDRVNNNLNGNDGNDSNHHSSKQGKGYRKPRKNNRGGQSTMPADAELVALHHPPSTTYSYQNQPVQSYPTPHHTTHNTVSHLQLSHHSPVLDGGSSGNGVTPIANNVTVTTAAPASTGTETLVNNGSTVIDNENNSSNVNDEEGYIGDEDEVDEDGEIKESKVG